MSALNPGTLLSHYRILSQLGAGGMGEVYLAEDTKLERKVAIKILPQHVAADEDRLRRFVKEAKTASALNHPNVAHVYEINESNGFHFIAMELVEGLTLDTRMKENPLSISDVLEISIQIADALQAAHGRGIIHRDLKPGNVMVGAGKQVKVLDFGLAKMIRNEAEQKETQLPTISGTEPGLVFGTVPYMSPEQALGRSVDARSDIFSMGSVLYEMAAGRRPFSGKTSSEMISQITHSQPLPIARFHPDVPAELERIVRKCLEKDPEERYQSAKDLLIDLKNLRRDSISGATATELHSPKTGELSLKTLIAIGSLILVAIVAIVFYLQSSSRRPIRSIAVLPFLNNTGDETVEYLSDGITDSTIHNLSQISDLRVIARPTVFSYKGKGLDPQKIGQELKVDSIVTGSIARRNDDLIIQTDMINVSEGTEIWGRQFNGNMSNILSLQSEISRQISENLRVHLTGKEQEKITKNYTKDSEAYRLYLQGLFFWNKANEDGTRKSIQYFQQSTEKDPLFALGYSGLSDSYSLLAMLGYLPPEEAWPKSRAAALKALDLDSELMQAYISLGTNDMFYRQEWKEAEKNLLNAAANPNSAYAHHILYIYYGATGNTQEAVRQILIAKELDPLDVLTACDTGYAYYLNRDFKNALLEESKALEMDPNYESALFIQSFMYVAVKNYPKAIESAEKAVAVSNRGPNNVATLGYAFGRAGNKTRAKELLAELEERSRTAYVSPYYFGLIHVALDQKDEAFHWLRKACEERTGDWGLIFLKTDPAMDPIRSDPRFTDLLTCMNLQP